MAEIDTNQHDLYSLLAKSANSATTLQRNNGSLPAGNNGPWGQKETPVRNTSHWAIVFKKAYEITGEEKYKCAVKSAGSYLMSIESRPHGETFKHRQGTEKDQSNGLIGQAWTIEALKEIATITNNSNYIEEARNVFLLHDFDEQTGLWHRVDVDGTKLKKDPTFNHQLWFAAAGSLIAEDDDEVRRQVDRFLMELPHTMRTHPHGRIYHSLLPLFNIDEYIRYLVLGDRYLPLRNIRHIYHKISPQHNIDYKNKEIGYHAFNLYGLALLKQNRPDHQIWESEIIQNTLEYTLHDEYQNRIINNRYGFPYNPPGFEVAFASHVFKFDRIDCEHWVSRQINAHFDFDSYLMAKNTSDPKTLSARIYEATRLPNFDIQL